MTKLTKLAAEESKAWKIHPLFCGYTRPYTCASHAARRRFITMSLESRRPAGDPSPSPADLADHVWRKRDG